MPRTLHYQGKPGERCMDQRGVPLPRRRDLLEEHPSEELSLFEYDPESSPPLFSNQLSHPPSSHLYSRSSGCPPFSLPKTFDDLPREVRVKIFQMLLSPYNISYLASISKQRRKLLQVCRRFRNLIVTTPALWTHISVSGPYTNHNEIQEHLENASGSGLWWVFDLRNHVDTQLSNPMADTWCTPEVAHSLLDSYLIQRMRNTTHLHIIIDTPSLFPVVFATLQGESAPILRELKITRGNLYDTPVEFYRSTFHQGRSMQEADPLFDGDTPELEMVQIHYVPAIFVPSIFKNLESHGGVTMQHLDLSMQPLMPPETFYGLLNVVAPALNTLVLRNAGPAFRTTLGSPPAYLICFPSLRRLVVGNMTARYLGRLLSTLSFRPLTSLGLHGISTYECEATWKLLLQHVVPIPLSHDRTSAEAQPVHAFGLVKELELFDLGPSKQMKHPLSQLEANNTLGTDSSHSWTKNAFSEFLTSAPALTEIRMRRVGLEFVQALVTSSPTLYDAAHPSIPILPAPTLERLEVCCVTRLVHDFEDIANDEGTSEEEEEVIPVPIKELASTLVEVLRFRNDALHPASIQQGSTSISQPSVRGIRRLHLDGEEWKSRHDPDDPDLHEMLAELGVVDVPAGELTWGAPNKGIAHVPIVHWDARAPFFADYYDSTEI